MSFYQYNANAVSQKLRQLQNCFDGEIFYAVKANPFPGIINDLLDGGVTGFDVASLDEIRTIRNLSADIPLIYTHPIKPAHSIEEAWDRWGIRAFAVDCQAEWEKIASICPRLDELEIFIRAKTTTADQNALIKLDEKFGMDLQKAIALAIQIQKSGATVSLCFHTGSQQTCTDAYKLALSEVAQAVQTQSLRVKRISIGGGFPVDYGDAEIPALEQLVPNIDQFRREFPVLADVSFIAEPGRFLSADSMDLVANVILVDDERIFIDDGVYGSLLDCALLKSRFPVRMHTRGRSVETKQFKLFGPTCDSIDQLPGLYELPVDISAGDQIKILKVGAYGSALTNNFNGLCPRPSIEITNSNFIEEEIQLAAVAI